MAHFYHNLHKKSLVKKELPVDSPYGKFIIVFGNHLSIPLARENYHLVLTSRLPLKHTVWGDFLEIVARV
jgi:hypothetical protein